MLRHYLYVGGQKQYIFSPLGDKIYFHAKLFHLFQPSNMAAVKTLYRETSEPV